MIISIRLKKGGIIKKEVNEIESSREKLRLIKDGECLFNFYLDVIESFSICDKELEG